MDVLADYEQIQKLNEQAVSELFIDEGSLEYWIEWFCDLERRKKEVVLEKDAVKQRTLDGYDYYLKDFYLKTDTGITSGRIECKEYKRPNPPTSIRFKPLKSSVKITWQKSYSSQGDVKGYQIYKRNSLSEPYSLVKQVDFFDVGNQGLERNNIKSFQTVPITKASTLKDCYYTFFAKPSGEVIELIYFDKKYQL